MAQRLKTDWILFLTVLVMVCFFMVASFSVGIVLGSITFAHKTAQVIWVVWLLLTLGFLFTWMMGLLAELQRSETIDLQRLTLEEAVRLLEKRPRTLAAKFELSCGKRQRLDLVDQRDTRPGEAGSYY